MPPRLDLKFYTRLDTAAIARDLLGKLLVVPDTNGKRVSGMIVETEAYLGEIDRAAHSYGGRRTARNEVMYSGGGAAYVFFVYGMYFQFNVVCGAVDHPHAILIRGIQPVEGIETMRLRRPAAKKDRDLTSGPGKLCIALGIDRSFNGEDLVSSERVWIESRKKLASDQIVVGKRIGIDYAGEDAELPLRFWLRDNPFVSRR